MVIKYLLIVANLLVGLPLAALPVTNQSGGPTEHGSLKSHQGDWMHSWEKAVEASRDKQLPLVVHFEAKWCGPCRRMASEILTQEEVRSLLGNTVIGVRIDADQHRELIDKFQIATLPTELVLAPDGTEQKRFVGAETKDNYVSRLRRVSSEHKPEGETAIAATESKSNAAAADESEETRSCLILRRDGKIVGLGGFSPVALKNGREWKNGREEFVATYQEVEYFLQSAEEVEQFKADPQRFIPHLHGCDLVELHESKEAKTGVIEFGAFYKDEMFFFASLENRERFQDNPAMYLASNESTKMIDNDLSPLLKSVVR